MTILVRLPHLHERNPLIMSDWCKAEGLVFNKDYDWHFLHTEKELIFRFHNDAAKYASLFSLRWS